jgi:hypothetical protein
VDATNILSFAAHWTLVSRQCSWSPRQGHASVAFRGGIYVLGGFDASGYCNDVHCLQVTPEVLECEDSLTPPPVPISNGISSNEDKDKLVAKKTKPKSNSFSATTAKSETSKALTSLSTKTITVSIDCVLESIAQLKQKRSFRERQIASFLSVVGFVRDALNGSGAADVGDDGTEENYVPAPKPSHGGFLAKRGSPLRDLLLASATGNNVKVVTPLSDAPSQTSHKHRMLGIPKQPSAGELSSAAAKAEIRQSRARSLDGVGSIAIKPFQTENESVHAYEIGESDMSSPGRDSVTVQRSDTPEPIMSSAALREAIDKDRSKVFTLQRLIRQAAENGDDFELQSFLDERALASQNGLKSVKHLLEHIIVVHTIQSEREVSLSMAVKKLEELAEKLFPSEDILRAEDAFAKTDSGAAASSAPAIDSLEDPENVILNKWTSLETECFQAADALNSEFTESCVFQFCRLMRDLSATATSITNWVDRSSPEASLSEVEQILAGSGGRKGDGNQSSSSSLSLSSSSSSVDFGSEKEGELDDAATDTSPNSYEKLCKQYDSTLSKLDSCKMDVKKAVDTELDQIAHLDEPTSKLLRRVLANGCALLRSLLSQILSDALEIASMKSELQEWNDLVSTLANSKALQIKIDGLLAEHNVMEEKLINLEDKRIDCRSLLEKAALKGQRRAVRPTFSSSEQFSRSQEDLASYSNDDIEDIKFQLAEAERAVKDTRREMRSWFRNVRKFATSVAPELFRLLPDLLSPGSVMGDGGFAENAKLLRRRLAEYDDIQPLVRSVIGPADLSALKQPIAGGEFPTPTKVMPMAGGAPRLITPTATPPMFPKSFPGRHAILKANFDGEEVVLKGFVMQDGPQRRGFEKEISILGRLKNDHIVCPRAIVDDVGSFAVEATRPLQVAVYIEYPFYKGGNLSSWLKASAHKPWELQGVARQIVYGLMFLHDHGVIHMVS